MKPLKYTISILSAFLLLVLSTASFAEVTQAKICNITLAKNIQLAQNINVFGPTQSTCQELGGLLVQFVSGDCAPSFLGGELLLVPGGSSGVNKIACDAISACNIPLPPALGLCSGV